MNNKIILASQSIHRKKLLDQLGLQFLVLPSNIDETPNDGETPKELVLRLAIEKSMFQVNNNPRAIIIGSDQVADIDGYSTGKPKDKKDAFNILMKCRGRAIPFHTGLCVIDPINDKMHTHIESYYIHYREYSEEELSKFLEKNLMLSCAGAIDWQGAGISLIEKLEGDDPNSLTGLPIIKLCEIFRTMKITL